MGRIAEIKRFLVESRAYTDAVFNALGERWEEQVYSDGLQWTARQIACHLADADRGHNAQVMSIAQGVNIIPEDFDIERYNRGTTRKTADKTAAQARAELAETRALLLAWLDEQDEAVLDNEGRHSSLRIMSVAQILHITGEHERMHARDIAQALGLQLPESSTAV